MHPEVQADGPGRCPKCGMALEPRTDKRQLGFTAGACVFLAVASFYLWTEHRAHLLGALPYVLLLLCPAMHLFMHRGHSHGSSRTSSEHGHPEGGRP